MCHPPYLFFSSRFETTDGPVLALFAGAGIRAEGGVGFFIPRLNLVEWYEDLSSNSVVPALHKLREKRATHERRRGGQSQRPGRLSPWFPSKRRFDGPSG